MMHVFLTPEIDLIGYVCVSYIIGGFLVCLT